MDFDIFIILLMDGFANGAIYLLCGLGLVLIFSVTRVIFIPFGDLVAFAALSLAAFQSGSMPGSVILLVLMALMASLLEVYSHWRQGALRKLPRVLFTIGFLPLVPAAAGYLIAGRNMPDVVQAAVAIALVLPMGVLLDRMAFQPIRQASALLMLIVALALHFMLAGIGLLVFGPEGARTKSIIDGTVSLGEITLPAQTILMVVTACVMSVVLSLLSERTITGKALRATAINRTGSRLVGIHPGKAAIVAHLVGAGLAGIAGLLIGPVTTIYYDSGFIIGLKAFVGAIIGGLASYPITAIGSIFVGSIESFVAFFASAYKEVIVFSIIIPVLIWRSFSMHHTDDEHTDEFG